MSYDYAKVQAWLAQVPTDDQSALYLWLECLIAHSMRFHEGTKLWELVNEFRMSSTWERTNMLYGLKDIADKVMMYDIHCYEQTARREDDARDPELQRILRERFEKSKTSTENIPDGSVGCSLQALPCLVCGQPWDQHICPHLSTMDPHTPQQISITLAPLPDNCPVCQQPFVHHQHPMKPPGVIISSTCGCTGETDDAKAQKHRRRGGAPPAR